MLSWVISWDKYGYISCRRHKYGYLTGRPLAVRAFQMHAFGFRDLPRASKQVNSGPKPLKTCCTGQESILSTLNPKP